MSDSGVAAVVGVGPGLGAATARRFARGGLAVALMARRDEQLTQVKQAVEAEGGRALAVPCDATDAADLAEAFARVRAELGEPSVLVYNVGVFRIAAVLDTDQATFEDSWRTNCLGGFLAAREAAPKMVERGKGTILFSGATASLRGSARFSCLAVGKFGLRALAQSLARELGPRGVHVAHVVIDGQILSDQARRMSPDKPTEGFISPEAIAETYWQLHQQDPTSWTLELDLRPSIERF